MKYLLALYLVMFPTFRPAMADPLRVIPPWHMTGNEVCYDLAGAKQLVLLDAKIINDQDLCLAVQTANDDYKSAVTLKQQQLDLQTKENARLSAALLQAIADKNAAEAKADGTPTTWLVIGGAGALILGVVIDAYVVHLKH